jgi:F-box/leucine-rich repeat protein 2/20
MEGEEEVDRSWADLEIIVEVLKRVGFQDLYVSVPLVCKAWRRASLDPACWVCVDMSKCFSSRKEVVDWWRPAFEAKMDYMVKLAVDRSYGGLRELSARHCSDSVICYLCSRYNHTHSFCFLINIVFDACDGSSKCREDL